MKDVLNIEKLVLFLDYFVRRQNENVVEVRNSNGGRAGTNILVLIDKLKQSVGVVFQIKSKELIKAGCKRSKISIQM